jgi:PleD family two-component response regulator
MSRILIVDDDHDLAELLKTKLDAEGHETFMIHTGGTAFEYAKQVKPELCILDVMLPDQTGYQICRKLRKDPELYKVAILILTALGEEPEILHGLEQGADDYLAKPFKLNKLMDKLTSLETLVASLQTTNPVTDLPGTDAIKREITHQLARGSAVAAIYIDIVGFKAYCAANGREGQQNALEFMSKLLVSTTRSMGIYEASIAHMGGEHFVVLLVLEDHERFCNGIAQAFDEGKKELFKPQDVEQGYFIARDRHGKDVRCPLMALSIGVAHTQYKNYKSAKKIFECLAQVRQMAKPKKGKSVIFVDRRHTDR